LKTKKNKKKTKTHHTHMNWVAWMVWIVIVLIVLWVIAILWVQNHMIESMKHYEHFCDKKNKFHPGDWIFDGSISSSNRWFRILTGQPCHASLVIQGRNGELYSVEAKDTSEKTINQMKLYDGQLVFSQTKNQAIINFGFYIMPLKNKIKMWKDQRTFINIYRFSKHSLWSNFCTHEDKVFSFMNSFWNRELALSAWTHVFHCGVWILNMMDSVYTTSTSTHKAERQTLDCIKSHPYWIESWIKHYESATTRYNFIII
jgi:hypothetical protein